MFLLAQFIGLAVLYKYIDTDKSKETGKTEFSNLPIGERPPIDENISYIPIIITILMGTGILLLLMRYNLTIVWKLWFLIAVLVSLWIAFSSVASQWIALPVATLLGIWRVFRPGVIIQTFTELFIYSGLAAIFVPMFNLSSISILMVLIALYDMWAVWKSKHMITLAKSQTKAKVFAGFMIPYKLPKLRKGRKNTKKIKVRTAILGGGDVGFPLIFAGVVMKDIGLWQSLIIPLFAAAGLAFLLFRGEEKKFYPAMPFIGAACFLGLGFVWLIGLI